MKNILIHRHSPLKIAGLTTRNRIVIPPMASDTANTAGFVTEKTLLHYERLAQAQTGILMVEYTYVHQTGRSEEHQLGIDHDSKIPGLKQLAQIIKQKGALTGIQLTHAGGKSEKVFTNGKLQGPSAVAVPVKDKEMEIPSTMDLQEIQEWKTSFIEAAGRAVAAGFDLVELHAAHGYGLNQWLSPITNKRKDHYGGCLENNLRLLSEIISGIKELYPELILAVRLPGQDFLEGGITKEDAASIAKSLEAQGVDLLDISSGIGGWRRPRDRTGEGYLVNEAAFIKSHLSIPVIGVGGIETGEYIDHILLNQSVSLAAVGRAILKNPQLWGQQQLGSYV